MADDGNNDNSNVDSTMKTTLPTPMPMPPMPTPMPDMGNINALVGRQKGFMDAIDADHSGSISKAELDSARYSNPSSYSNSIKSIHRQLEKEGVDIKSDYDVRIDSALASYREHLENKDTIIKDGNISLDEYNKSLTKPTELLNQKPSVEDEVRMPPR